MPIFFYIHIDSNDTDARRMRLYKNMHKITVKIYFTTDNYTSNVSDIWCDEPYLVIEYGTKQDLHSSKIQFKYFPISQYMSICTNFKLSMMKPLIDTMVLIMFQINAVLARISFLLLLRRKKRANIRS